MVEAGAPSRIPSFIPAVGEIGGNRVETRARALANQVDDRIDAEDQADMISGAYAAVLDDDVRVSDLTPCSHERLSERWQHGAQPLVEGKGIQSVGYDDLYAGPSLRVECGDAVSATFVNQLARCR